MLSQSMHMFSCGMYTSPVTGLKLLGFQSFAPEAVGQMLWISSPSLVCLSGLTIRRPVFRSSNLGELEPRGRQESPWVAEHPATALRKCCVPGRDRGGRCRGDQAINERNRG